jgi:hypothetical protein
VGKEPRIFRIERILFRNEESRNFRKVWNGSFPLFLPSLLPIFLIRGIRWIRGAYD